MLSDISFDHKIFEGARIELDQALRETINEMLYNQKLEGNVALKLKIEIKEFAMNGDSVPEFSFKVSTNIPSRNSIGGKLHSYCTLSYEDGVARIRTTSVQTSMLDERSAEE